MLGKSVHSVLGNGSYGDAPLANEFQALTPPASVIRSSRALLAARSSLLEALAKGDVGPAVILSGGSGSGKSYVCKLLRELGCEQAERLISRPKRSCDPETDRSWTTFSGVGSPEVLLSYAKNKGLYGVPTSTLKALASSHMEPVFIVGDLGKISPYNRAVDLASPLAPRINIRLDVPVDVMADRLTHQRLESFEGEGAERSQQNKLLFSWEAAQHRVVKQIFNLHVILNLTDDEHRRLGYAQSQIKPLSLSLLKELLPVFAKESIDHSRRLAQDILLPRELHDIPGLPPGIIEVLDENLVPRFASHDVDHFAIKGGLAVAAYLNGSLTPSRECHEEESKPKTLVRKIWPSVQLLRPVSADIDWAIPNFANEKLDHLNMVRAITGRDVSFQDHWNKSIFNSNKLHAVVRASTGQEIELDAIALSRVRPTDSPFCFEFPLDEYLAFRSRPLTIAGNTAAALVPPEMLIVEKLLAGRGVELGKLDIFDAVALIATQSIDVHVIDHMINSQVFVDGMDQSSDLSVFDDPVSSGTAWRDTLHETGIRHPEIVLAIINRFLAAPPLADRTISQSEGLAESDVALDFQKTRDNLKRIALVDCLLRNLDVCLATIASDAPCELSSIVDSCGKELLTERLRTVRDYLLYLATFQIGRPDVYIRPEPLSALRVQGWQSPEHIRNEIAHDHM